MILPFKKPNNVNLDIDDKGLYLYLGFNIITFLFFLSILFISLNLVLFILLILSFIIPALITYYRFSFLYLFIWFSQIALGLIVFSILFTINKLINKYLYESKANKRYKGIFDKRKIYFKPKKYLNEEDDLSGELL